MSDAILVLNAGSSSLKFAVFARNEDIFAPALRGKIAGIGTDPMFSARDGAGARFPTTSRRWIAARVLIV